jgi:hypothetical protein
MDLKHFVEAAFLPWGLMMVPRRRVSDDADDAQTKAAALVKPMMMPMFTAALAVLGVSAGPVDKLHNEFSSLQKEVVAARTDLATATVELVALRDRVSDISTRHTALVADLERRILACELNIAEARGRRK